MLSGFHQSGRYGLSSLKHAGSFVKILKEIRECGLKEHYGLLVLGAKDNVNEIEFNPPPTRLLAAGTTLIVMGAVEEIARAREAF
ncbi:MAG: TrkA C-terminal domain-containing protein [Desulfobacterales bacterium]|jgi:Trk K+ transport system NAD-binding subunit